MARSCLSGNCQVVREGLRYTSHPNRLLGPRAHLDLMFVVESYTTLVPNSRLQYGQAHTAGPLSHSLADFWYRVMYIYLQLLRPFLVIRRLMTYLNTILKFVLTYYHYDT